MLCLLLKHVSFLLTDYNLSFEDTSQELLQEWLHEAKKDGLTLSLRHAKVMFCGASKVGKTSFSCLLRNMPLDKNYRSTSLGEAQQILISQKVDVTGSEWKNLDIEMEMQKIMQHFITKLEKNRLPTDSIPDEAVLSIVRPENDPGNSSIHEDAVLGQSSVQQSHIENSTVSVEKHMISLTQNFSQGVPEVWDLLTLLDTGGQPEFVNMLPAINASTALTFLVLNLSEGTNCLDQSVVAQHSDPHYKSYTKSYSNLHLLECLMSSVKESANKVPYYPSVVEVKGERYLNPAVCFIGTHSDILGDSLGNVVETVNKQIAKSVKSINTGEELSVWSYDGKYLVVVDNTVAGKGQIEDSIAGKIRLRISKEVMEKKAQYEIPIAWFILELQLRCENKVYIPLNDVKIIADKIMPRGHKMEDWQLIEALKFYHSIGVLLYFDEEESGMSEVVITDPQWLFNNLTKLVTCTFVREKFLDAIALDKFANGGNFSKKLLQDIDLDIRGIKKESFLQLLEYLKVIASIDDIGQQYFMPCVLPTCEFASTIEEEQDCIYGKQVFYKHNGKDYVKVEPLLIKFTFGVIPRGFFCFLTVQLLQNNRSWTLDGDNDDDNLCRYDNLITFCIDTCHYLSLVDKISYLELQVRVNDEELTFVHFEVQEAVTSALKTTCQKLGWQYSDLRYGFLCKKCHHRPTHLTLLSKTEPIPKSFPKYANCGRQGTKLEEAHEVWFSVLQVRCTFHTEIFRMLHACYKCVYHACYKHVTR